MDASIVEVQRVTKRFGRRIALDAVDLHLPCGRIMAMVGPNGSGKTTLLKLLAGFLRPTEGSVRLFGLDPRRQRAEVMVRTRFAFAPPALYPNLTARETLRGLVRMGRHRSTTQGQQSRDRQGADMPASDLKMPRSATRGAPHNATLSCTDTPSGASSATRPGDRAIDAALETVGLLNRADDRVRVFSFGMRQRLALAQAITPMPRLLVLDEPTDGLDPLAVVHLRYTLRRLRDEHGVTILLSSHLIAEVEKLVDDLVLLHEGKVLYCGTPAALRRSAMTNGRFAQGALHLRFDGEAEIVAESFRSRGLRAAVIASDEVALDGGAITLNEAAGVLTDSGATLRAFHERTPTLEVALLHRLRDAGADGDRSAGDAASEAV